ncbi:hypothetical protein [Streptomyces massasporeus]|uniref:hypothetical protein n=1 Tax=Streptomyces massasporeus TaxID=67324 RepID=UPI0037F65A66
MRRTATTITAALLLALTACGSGDDTASASKPSASPSVDRAGQFITASQDLEFVTMRPSNDELLTFPPRWCKELEAGHSVEWMFDMFGDGGDLYPLGDGWGMLLTDANELLVAGVRAYCPKHLDTVTEELRASGEY